MILIAWLVCVSVAGALLYVGLNAIAGLRDACANVWTAPAAEPASTEGSPRKGITILPPGPRNQPNGNGHDHTATPAARQPTSRKPGQQA